MSDFVPVLVLAPLAAGAGGLLLASRPRLRHLLALVTTAGVLAGHLALLVHISQGAGEVRVATGAITPPLGIELVADPLATIVGAVAAAVTLAVLVATRTMGPPELRSWFGLMPLLMLLLAGSQLAFLTGDLFTLFVAVEVTLLSSTVLLARAARGSRDAPLRAYLGVNLAVSALFLLAVAGVYVMTGTINLADLAERWPQAPAAPRALVGGLLLVVLGVKAGAAPVFTWLPATYPSMPPVLGALYAALLTKVGVAALLRVATALDLAETPDPLLLTVASATMLLGVLGALAQNNIGRILSWHVVSQVGYMLFGLALFDLAGLAGAIIYIAHHMLIKAALFLVAAAIEDHAGTLELKRLGGLARTHPGLGWLFGLAAMTLIGIPPTSGFVAKLSLVDAGIAAGTTGAAVSTGVALLVGLLTMLSMTKIWIGAFWGEPRSVVDRPVRSAAVPAAWGLLAATGMVSLLGGPLADVARTGAELLLGIGGAP